MKLDEERLGKWLARARGPVLRHETAEAYDVQSDGNDYQRYLAGERDPDPAVGAGWRQFVRDHDVRRVRVLYGPPSRFVCFESEWQYTLNQQAGEGIRVLDASRTPAETNQELWVAEGEVAVMIYRRDHSFDHAVLSEDKQLAAAAWSDYRHGQPFPVWWAEHPEYHRESWLSEAALSG